MLGFRFLQNIMNFALGKASATVPRDICNVKSAYPCLDNFEAPEKDDTCLFSFRFDSSGYFTVSHDGIDVLKQTCSCFTDFFHLLNWDSDVFEYSFDDSHLET